MSAAITLRQRESVHLMTDTASYQVPSGILVSVNCLKSIVMPTIRAALACTGPADLGAYFGYHLSNLFSTFDELIGSADRVLPQLFEAFAEDKRNGDATTAMNIIGWHERADRPAAYSIDLWTDDSSKLEKILSNSPNAAAAVANKGKITEQIFAGTVPPRELVDASGFVTWDDDERFIPELDLLHMLEVCRHEEVSGKYWVGGKALLTSIDQKGLTQRVVHHWAEDKVGDVIQPAPIDWKQWRAERERLRIHNVIPAGLSRLQRERLEKKARKGTLRAV
jgi:hypothetical protein